MSQAFIKIDQIKIKQRVWSKQVYNSRVDVDNDNKLKWNNHIDIVAKNVSSGAMRWIRDFARLGSAWRLETRLAKAKAGHMHKVLNDLAIRSVYN